MRFSMAQIVTITTGVMLVDDIGEIYKILNFMTGVSLFTHQLPRAGECCIPAIHRQYPELAEIDAAHVDENNWDVFLEECLQKYGTHRDIEPLEALEYTAIDPITEMQLMGVSDDRIIALVLPEKEDTCR